MPTCSGELVSSCHPACGLLSMGLPSQRDRDWIWDGYVKSGRGDPQKGMGTAPKILLKLCLLRNE